jgi:hypothetical protein
MNQEIVHLFKAAVECSIFLNPVEPGLTYGELREIGQRAGYQAGEINDALRYAGEVSAPGKDRIIPDQHERASFVFYMEEEPDFRNLKAFDFAISQLNERVKVDGMQNAQLARAVLVERAVRADIPRNDIEAAITCLIMSNTLTERHEVLRFDGFRGFIPSRVINSKGVLHLYVSRIAHALISLSRMLFSDGQTVVRNKLNRSTILRSNWKN